MRNADAFRGTAAGNDAPWPTVGGAGPRFFGQCSWRIWALGVSVSFDGVYGLAITLGPLHFGVDYEPSNVGRADSAAAPRHPQGEAGQS